MKSALNPGILLEIENKMKGLRSLRILGFCLNLVIFLSNLGNFS